MNYAALFETIKGYVENDFPDTQWTDSTGTGTVTLTSKEQVDSFIRQAEERIFNSVQLLELRKNVLGNCSAGNRYLALPDDWLATFSVAVIDGSGNYSYLLNKDVSYIREAFPNPSYQDIPTHYSYFDDNSYLLAPTPDDTYQVEMHYFYYPPSIVDAGESWLGNNFDTVLLYGALLEAYTFMKGEADIVALYQQRYSEALDMLKQLGEAKNRQDNFRVPQVRYPVR